VTAAPPDRDPLRGGNYMATFLVADDAAFMRMRCVKLLKEGGHETVEVENGKQAVEAYQRLKPDAVLLDITMPEMDGLEALRQILAGDPKARVAMVTAVGQQSVVIDALKIGACDFVVKPFQPTRFLQAVHRLLEPH
jgi:two-component system, chemotaxis family, chemotaxis protein CheY